MSLEDLPTNAVLSVRDLSVSFATRQGVVRAVDGLSFDVGAKEVLGIVGESGSGKSVAMYSMLGLVRDANVSISGSVRFEGREILGLSDTEMQSVRGGEVGMIFQDPMTALTPVYTVGWQIVEQLRAHNDMTKKAAYERATELLAEVGIPDPKSRVNHYPHEFSGGMRQRVVIAMALSCNPKLLIADEPTTALDVTTQAQILDRDHHARHGRDRRDRASRGRHVRGPSGGDRTGTGRRSLGAPPVHLGAAGRGATRGHQDSPTRHHSRQRRLAAGSPDGLCLRAAVSVPHGDLRATPATTGRRRSSRRLLAE